MTEGEKGYIAGIIDGEGCIYIDRQNDSRGRLNPSYTLRIRVSMTDWEVPKFLHKKLGGSLYAVPQYEYTKGNRQQMMWMITGKKAIILLEILLPYLICKEKQAKVAIEFKETIFNNHERDRKARFLPLPKELIVKKENLYALMKKANQREED